MGLVIVRAFLPDECDVVSGEWHLEVPAKLGIALESQHDQVLLEFAEITPQRCELATVDVEDFDHVAVDGCLGFR